MTMILHLPDLPLRKRSAMKRKIRRLGVTPSLYVRQLIEDDLALDQKARTTSLAELAAPIRNALGSLSEDDLDGLVDAARGKRERKTGKRGG